MSMRSLLTMVITLWFGIFFLYQFLEPFPEKEELIKFQGEVLEVNGCKGGRRSSYKQLIKASNEKFTLRFFLICSNNNVRLTSNDIESKANILYEIKYFAFIYKQIDVYDFKVGGRNVRDYSNRAKNYKGGSYLSLLAAILFLTWFIFSLRKHLTNAST